MPIRLLVSVTALLLIACGPPRIRIEWTRAPAFTLPVETPVSIKVEADGTQPPASAVLDGLIGLGRGQVLNKWAAVGPVYAELDLNLRHAGHQVVPPDDATLTVKVTPTGWQFQPGSGRIDALIEVIDPKDPAKPPLYASTYWATGGSGNSGEMESLARASRQLALAFLRALQPRRVSANVVLDDSDPAADVGIQLCKDGQFDAAYTAFSDAMAKNPSSPAVVYDLAVLAEARGDYDLAESLLTKATGLAQKAIYYSALERVRGARADQGG